MNGFNEETNQERFDGTNDNYHFKINGQTENLQSIVSARNAAEEESALRRYMPIGSIIQLGNGVTQMIVGFKAKNNGNEFDYLGCNFPAGISDLNSLSYFNHDQITRVYHIGFYNAQAKAYQDSLLNGSNLGRQ